MPLLTLPNGQSVSIPNISIPLELYGTKVNVVLDGVGGKVSIKLAKLAKVIATEYLSKVFPTMWLTELVNSFLDFKFACTATAQANYKKPKREGLSGLALDVTNNLFSEYQSSVIGNITDSRLEIWNTKDDILNKQRKWKISDPIRSYSVKIVGKMSMTPKTPWIPFMGKMKLAYSVTYDEYLDRIEVSLGDITIAGGIKYRLDVQIPYTKTTLKSAPNSIEPQLINHGTLVPSAPFSLVANKTNENWPLEGASKIKALSFKETFQPATFIYNKQTRRYGFMSDCDQSFRLLLIFIIIFFSQFTCAYADLSRERHW
jgi:hypothetical protein